MLQHTYFIDWNGQVRSTQDPGPGLCCLVDSVAGRVTVIDKRGSTVHETRAYRSLQALARTGIETVIVPSSLPVRKGATQRQSTATPPRSVGPQHASHPWSALCECGAQSCDARQKPVHWVSRDTATQHSDPSDLPQPLAATSTVS